MKILKYLLGVLAILAVGFMLLGVFKPSVTYGNEIEINKPLKESWAVMMDASKANLWVDGIKSMELISGKEGEVGAVSKILMAPKGEDEFEMMETITAVDVNKHHGLAFDTDFMDVKWDAYLSEKDGKTIIRTEALAKGKGMFMKSMFALMGSSMTQEDLKMMTSLKKAIEENTTDYFPAPVLEAVIAENEDTSTDKQ